MSGQRTALHVIAFASSSPTRDTKQRPAKLAVCGQDVCVGIAQGREWTEGGVAALEAVTEGYLRLWTEHKQHLEQQRAEQDEAFRCVETRGEETRRGEA